MSSHRMKSQNYKMQTFSFLVIARNSHEGTANVRNSVTRKWTRLTVPTLKRTGHVICDGCTESGQLQRTIRTKAEGKTAFKDLRKRKWGDALPPAEFYQSLLDEPIPA
ncbi:hypothetical protein SARC_03612 [Sphaeroforma arctica JP610]|uniref:Uncharacterized protein n=1 Tax=Sphaeroforma arctica JP610 TaxID=667725 RepID=A0A0L0G5Q6_9EUKA|nr:hypothetical protein SARC_03612 [Sphaeroforma arctica JP610]KNC84156.1 hypothetical protein SARC_03612 [Sphaeroforma arctica JP610]|eukprot:XP_014158058.1 hypothetical protein SARC_03612 [Sphaeroforma arctica JP610]